MLCLQVLPTVQQFCESTPIWQEHLVRDAALCQRIEQARQSAMQSSPLYHALLA